MRKMRNWIKEYNHGILVVLSQIVLSIVVAIALIIALSTLLNSL